MKTLRLSLVGLLATALSLTVAAQTATIQDCLGAIPVCQETYSESSSPVGTGSVNEIQSGETCTDGELNSIWYLFTTNETGSLGFVITPNNLNDDYDWALFNLTNATCADLLANPNSLIVSCNAAGGPGCHGATGATGATNLTNVPGGCGFGNSPLNALVPMQAGQTFALMISNWTGSVNGYTIDFSPSTGVDFIDNVAPEVSEAIPPQSCGDNEITLTYSEFMSCQSMQSSAFVLTGPGGPYTVSVQGVACQQGATQSTEFVLTISPAIQSRGAFTLTIDPTTANQVLDLCGNQQASYTYNFVVDVPIPIFPNIGADTSLVCAGDTLLLDASSQGTMYLWSDGSTLPTLPVTNAGTYSVTIEDACGVGTDAVDVVVQMEPPVVDLGADQQICPGESVAVDVTNSLSTYLWSDGPTVPMRTLTETGSYAVSVTNACGTTERQIEVVAVPPIVADFGEQVLCYGETAVLDFTHPFATYAWSDGQTTARREITEDIDVDLTITTPCETVSGNIAIVFLRDPTLQLGADTTLCAGDSLVLAPGIPGGGYRWQDGSTANTLLVTGPGLYELVLTTACNELRDTREVSYIPRIQTDLGRDTFLCEGASLRLDATAQAPVSYRWEDGTTEAVRRVDEPGTDLVSVLSDCEAIFDTLRITRCEMCEVYVPNVFSPNGDGANDRFLAFSDCPLTDYSLQLFDRWGRAVFATQDPALGWAGTIRGQAAPTGVYVWSLAYTVIEDGYVKQRTRKGDVVLVR